MRHALPVIFVFFSFFNAVNLCAQSAPPPQSVPDGGGGGVIEEGQFLIIEHDIKDPYIKREIDKLINPPKLEFYFDFGINRLEYQKIDFIMQEWKISGEAISDMRIYFPLAVQGGEYNINAGYIFHKFWGGGAYFSMPLFPFIERDAGNVLPVLRADIVPYIMFNADIGGFMNFALAAGPHLGYYDYKQIMEPANGGQFNGGQAYIETRILSFGIALMPQVRFNISKFLYLGARANIIFDFAAASPVIEKPYQLDGASSQYNYYFKGNFAVKYGIYAGFYLRKYTVFHPRAQRTYSNAAPAGENPEL
ncbi:MAG: hypothetical protein LBG72_10565 [Spirochaetaceae bacterium]|jgi:hypothetical protein|nr:hypothetical protein [Spirochaetaceae bacterium]